MTDNITLEDYFAGQAMAAIIQNPDRVSALQDTKMPLGEAHDIIALAAWDMARAMTEAKRNLP